MLTKKDQEVLACMLKEYRDLRDLSDSIGQKTSQDIEDNPSNRELHHESCLNHVNALTRMMDKEQEIIDFLDKRL